MPPLGLCQAQLCNPNTCVVRTSNTPHASPNPPFLPLSAFLEQEFITLPPAFYLELDLEQNVVVERASSSPLSLLRAATGSREVELHRLIKVGVVRQRGGVE